MASCPGASATTRRGGTGYLTSFSVLVDFTEMRCLKVPKADPTIPYSFLPSFHLDGVMVCDYDFVPEVNHMRFVERPECGVVPFWNGFRQNRPVRNEVGTTSRDFGLLSGVG